MENVDAGPRAPILQPKALEKINKQANEEDIQERLVSFTYLLKLAQVLTQNTELNSIVLYEEGENPEMK